MFLSQNPSQNPNQRKFTLIKGGSTPGETKEFVSAYVTDTRLMGVVGLYIDWDVFNRVYINDFHQFFYFDAEEFGLESYHDLTGVNNAEVEYMEKKLFDGLGGKKIPLTEDEACFLVQSFAEDTERLGQPLPARRESYDFILKRTPALTEEEKKAAVQKMCTPIESDYQLIHYYLMRAFGKDEKGMSYLTPPDRDPEQFTEIGGAKPASLCKNTIDEFIDSEGNLSYLNESILETGSHYQLAISELRIKNGLVVSAQRRSAFPISIQEVSMMLARPEFVTVFEILIPADDFDTAFSTFSVGFTMTSHDNGRLFMQFNKNNDHVKQRTFFLNNDIRGLYYITDFGQMILCAYSLPAIQRLEAELQKSAIGMDVLPTAKYEFKNPILYEFIHSEFEDFEDFLDDLQSNDH